MSKPTTSQILADRAAAMVTPNEGKTENRAIATEAAEDKTQPRKKGGRPPGRRDVAARITVNLDERRHAALALLAQDQGRSIHSIIIEGIDRITGKPSKNVWE